MLLLLMAVVVAAGVGARGAQNSRARATLAGELPPPPAARNAIQWRSELLRLRCVSSASHSLSLCIHGSSGYCETGWRDVFFPRYHGYSLPTSPKGAATCSSGTNFAPSSPLSFFLFSPQLRLSVCLSHIQALSLSLPFRLPSLKAENPDR